MKVLDGCLSALGNSNQFLFQATVVVLLLKIMDDVIFTLPVISRLLTILWFGSLMVALLVDGDKSGG